MFKEKMRKAIAHYGKTKDLKPVLPGLKRNDRVCKKQHFGLEFRFTDALPEIVTMLSSLKLEGRTRKVK